MAIKPLAAEKPLAVQVNVTEPVADEPDRVIVPEEAAGCSIVTSILLL